MKTMSKMMMSVAVAAVVVLSGCASGPDLATRQAADYGTYPANYQEVITAYHDQVMKDPESARVKYLSGPVKWVTKMNPFAGETLYGYLVCMDVNAKNSYGAYTGNEVTAVFIRDGRVVRYLRDNRDETAVHEACAKAVAQSGEVKQ